MKNRWIVVLLLVILVLGGCGISYQRQVVPFKLPAAYPNAVEVAGATIAAQAYDNPQGAKEAFGFDIRRAGLCPVQVIFDNSGDHSLEVVASQTFLVDNEGNLWPVLDASQAYDRITKKSEMATIGKKAAKSGFLGGAAGAVLGAAIGIVAGENVLSSAGKGAALGAAAGATVGGAGAVEGADARAEVAADLREKSLRHKPIEPHTIAHGFIFFPGEAKEANELRLQLRVIDTDTIHNLRLKL